MNAARTILVILGVLVVGAIGYQIGITQNVAAQLPAGAAPVAYPYWYGPHWFGFGFLGFLFPILFFFLFFGLLRWAFWGGRGWGHGYGWDERRRRFEEIHRELHGEKPSQTQTPDR